MDNKRERQRRYRATHKEEILEYRRKWVRDNPEKHKAHYLVGKAVKSGELIKPTSCEFCGGGGRVEAHHRDYSMPLDVLWLCGRCHRIEHGGPPSGPKKIHKGSSCKTAKLKEIDVIRIKALLKTGKLEKRKIAEIFGVHESSIRLIEIGETWAHIS